MARVTLTVDEAAPGVLPPTCMVCGVPAEVRLPVRYAWVPGWTYLLLLCGLVPWLVVRIVLARRMTVESPACGRHRNYWRWRTWLLPAGLLASFALLVLPSLAGPQPSGRMPAWGLVAAAAVFHGTIATAVWLRLTGVRRAGMSRDEITLVGVAPEFAAALEAGRAEYLRREQEWLKRHDPAQ